MIGTGAVPLFFHRDPKTAKRILAACAEGGARAVEFTNRGEGALEVFRELVRYAADVYPDLILGAGSVPDAPTAALFLQAGANFIVAPFTDEQTALLCNGRKVAYLPGCGSVSEIHRAEQLGVEICKVFPGSQVGGPGFIKSVKAPCPWSRLMPTGGVSPTEESLQAWFEAGAACVGLGSRLIPATTEPVSEEITEKMQFSISYIRRLRESRGLPVL